ncbi:LacI family DNA-binding transcriptional regulator [Sodalis ligni]|uniref:LacI family DNA-binding transcriptional regulator n=1 Tax=Sodalis ligni TaxID=2697027 RepID=UPI00193F0F7D|nr:LacI family DNA-binding transcriptional regulator [Sodalis ligni]QWA13273.1 LacI family DNA-binding transcriptional regulator [Sodalis ligni]
MITMQDVARKAGVSKSTVSRVLAGNNYVKESTRQRVFNAIEESGYRPNLVARSLATQNSQSIGLIVTNSIFNGPYFSELLYQTAKMTENYGRQLILVDGKYSAESELESIQFLLDRRCDAVIIYPRFLGEKELMAIIRQHEIPFIVINRNLPLARQHCVFATHQADARQAVGYLIEQGHRDIAFISGAQGSPTAGAREQGYRQALREKGISLNEALMAPGHWSLGSGYEACAELLRRPAGFSALVCCNDDMAIGAAKALREHGKTIPGDISLVSFDDIPVASYFNPPLTTVHVPVAEMIKSALDQVVHVLDGKPVSPLKPFSGELVIRDSVVPGPFAATSRQKKTPVGHL